MNKAVSKLLTRSVIGENYKDGHWSKHFQKDSILEWYNLSRLEDPCLDFIWVPVDEMKDPGGFLQGIPVV